MISPLNDRPCGRPTAAASSKVEITADVLISHPSSLTIIVDAFSRHGVLTSHALRWIDHRGAQRARKLLCFWLGGVATDHEYRRPRRGFSSVDWRTGRALCMRWRR